MDQLEAFDRFLAQGEKLGLANDSLIEYINQQQARLDRAKDREERQKEAELQAKQKEAELQAKQKEAELQAKQKEAELQEIKIKLEHEATILRINHEAKIELGKIETEKLKYDKVEHKPSHDVLSKLPKIPPFSPKSGDSFDSFLYQFEIQVKKLQME